MIVLFFFTGANSFHLWFLCHFKSNISNKQAHFIWLMPLAQGQRRKGQILKSTRIYTLLILSIHSLCNLEQCYRHRAVHAHTHIHTAASPSTNYHSCDLTRPGQRFQQNGQKQTCPGISAPNYSALSSPGGQCCR